MSTEANFEFLEEIDIKEEINSDSDEGNAQNKYFTQKFQNNSSKSCVNVQILSYKDIEGIKEEFDSENENEEEKEEQINHFDVENSQENFENEVFGLSRNQISGCSSNILQRHKASLNIPKTTSIYAKNPEFVENLDKTIEIKTEDEVEYRIIQLSDAKEVESHLEATEPYQNHNDELNSIIKFEKQDESTRAESQENFDDKSSKTQKFIFISSNYTEMDPKDQEDSISLQNTGESRTISKNLTCQSYEDLKIKQEIEKNPVTLENWYEGSLNPHLSHSIHIKQEDEVNFTDDFTENLNDNSKYGNSKSEDHEEPENLQDFENSEQNIERTTILGRDYVKIKKKDPKKAKDACFNPQSSQKSSFSLQNHQQPNLIALPSSKTYIKQEPEVNFIYIIPENYLEVQILHESSKIFGNKAKISDPCSQKLLKLSKMLEKPTQNEKIISKISEMTMKDSQSISKEATDWAQVITKSIKLDKEDIAELPIEIIEKFKIKKFSMNFEKREGQIVHIYNIPYYVCTSCSTVFITQNVFFIHYKILHATVEKPFDCWKCTTSYSTWKDLIVHKKCHDDHRLYSCKYCFYQFKLRETLLKHVEKVHVEKIKNISCEICGRNFDTEREMLIHKNRHNGKGRIIKVGPSNSYTSCGQRLNGIKCIFCPAQFLKTDDLEKHYKTHKALEKMKCRSCGKEVMVKPQYIIKNISMREFKCISCDLAANEDKTSSDAGKSIKILNKQIKIENFSERKAAEEAMTSESANSREKSKEEPRKVITMTMDKETKKLSVKCYVCGIELSSNIKLFWHMKGHLEQHQFNCPVCRKDFKSRELMIEHCKIEHSKTNVTKCEICNKEFHFVDLETHMKTHEAPQEPKPIVKVVKPPKIIRLDAISEPSKVSKSPIQAKTTQKVMLPTIHSYKSTGIVVRPSSKQETVFFGAKCPTCKEYVLYKDMYVHNMKHDKEKTSKLIQRIQDGRKREEFLNKLRNPSTGLSDGRKIVGNLGTRVILKRRAEESQTSGMEKKIKIGDENC